MTSEMPQRHRSRRKEFVPHDLSSDSPELTPVVPTGAIAQVGQPSTANRSINSGVNRDPASIGKPIRSAQTRQLSNDAYAFLGQLGVGEPDFGDSLFYRPARPGARRLREHPWERTG